MNRWELHHRQAFSQVLLQTLHHRRKLVLVLLYDRPRLGKPSLVAGSTEGLACESADSRPAGAIECASPPAHRRPAQAPAPDQAAPEGAFVHPPRWRLRVRPRRRTAPDQAAPS
jgi:hypothetical protein